MANLLDPSPSAKWQDFFSFIVVGSVRPVELGTRPAMTFDARIQKDFRELSLKGSAHSGWKIRAKRRARIRDFGWFGSWDMRAANKAKPYHIRKYRIIWIGGIIGISVSPCLYMIYHIIGRYLRHPTVTSAPLSCDWHNMIHDLPLWYHKVSLDQTRHRGQVSWFAPVACCLSTYHIWRWWYDDMMMTFRDVTVRVWPGQARRTRDEGNAVSMHFHPFLHLICC